MGASLGEVLQGLRLPLCLSISIGIPAEEDRGRDAVGEGSCDWGDREGEK